MWFLELLKKIMEMLLLAAEIRACPQATTFIFNISREMSRFWAGGSSSESENESQSDSDEEVQNPKVAAGKFVVYDSDSDSEDEVRVVKSHKDKAWDSMRDSIGRLRSAMKINDWKVISEEFIVTNKIIEKSRMLIIKNGMPKFYIKMLGDLEDFLVTSLKNKEAIKKMKKEVSSALNKMKLSVRKHNKNYEEEIAAYRANPTDYEEAEEESSSESESDSDSDQDSSEEEDSDEDSDEDDDSDEDSSEEDEAPKKKAPVKPKVGYHSE